VFRVVSARIKKSLIAQKINPEKIFVLPIFVDVERFNTASIKTNLKQKYPQFNFIILMAARLSPEKNIGLAIEAMAGIIKKYPKAGLVIVGSGPEENNLKLKIARLASRAERDNLKLRDNIVLEPWTDDLISYLKSADLFLLTSNYEGWGMVVAEAAAAGCPIVMTDVGCAGELVVNNESGLVVPPGNKTALITALSRSLADESLRKKFKVNALEAAKKMPTKRQYLADYRKSWE